MLFVKAHPVIVIVREFEIAPPFVPVFDAKVEFVTVRVPLFEIAPPEPLEEFWLKLEFVMFRVVPKSEKIAPAPPPPMTPFELKATFVTVKLPRLSTAARTSLLLASVSVIPLIEKLSQAKKICTTLLPLTVKIFAPGPLIVSKSLVVESTTSVLAKVIVRAVLKKVESKLIVSACAFALASVTACRKLPAPLLFEFVTVNVAASARMTEMVSVKSVVKIIVPNNLRFVRIYLL